ncbi:MAG: glycosyltransferase [Lachnospiraceae bacterium]|nr:glycosyltransferase [Lachnospiraceae bacterium]MEE0919794.1 glycosyltransferase [Lachnospiraceae bacterium]
MNKKISVIIPVYNAEKYLKRCIESVINQTYKNLEIIMVDDGSKDNSGSMCDEYAAKDNRIKVIHKQNSGVSDTRNTGLDNVTGDMIAFVDSDDYIVSDFFEKLYSLKGKENAHIAMCNFSRFSKDIVKEEQTNPEIKSWTGRDILNNIYGVYGNLFSGVLWNKLYDACLFDGLKFPVNLRNEDEFMLPKVLDRAGKLVYTSEKLYFYFENDNSITTDNKYLSSDYIYRVFDERMEYFSKKGSNYDSIVKATKKAYLDRIIIRYKKTADRKLFDMYKVKYKEFKSGVNGIGYSIFAVSPGFYFFLVKIMGK